MYLLKIIYNTFEIGRITDPDWTCQCAHLALYIRINLCRAPGRDVCGFIKSTSIVSDTIEAPEEGEDTRFTKSRTINNNTRTC